MGFTMGYSHRMVPDDTKAILTPLEEASVSEQIDQFVYDASRIGIAKTRDDIEDLLAPYEAKERLLILTSIICEMITFAHVYPCEGSTKSRAMVHRLIRWVNPVPPPPSAMEHELEER